MSVLSMTGFGRGEAGNANLRVTIELSCVNRKQLDVNLSMPREWAALEPHLLGLIRKRCARGYIKGTVSAHHGDKPMLSEAVRKQVHFVRMCAAELGLPDDLTASSLLRLQESGPSLPGVDGDDEVLHLTEIALNNALDALDAMRVHEGAALAADVRARLKTLQSLWAQISSQAPDVPRQYLEVLKGRLAALMPEGVKPCEEMLARELAVFADRCDVSEELTRLGVHFEHAERLLQSEEPCGRALDFLCQEFFREINTTGSKANDAEITKVVIAFKAQLETIREQVQNIA